MSDQRSPLMPLLQKNKSKPIPNDDKQRALSAPKIRKLQTMYDIPSSRPPTNSSSNPSHRSLTTGNPLASARMEYTPIKLIEKLVQNLPTELRENILEIANLMSTSEKKVKDMLEKQTAELLALQTARDQKNAELHTAKYAVEVHRRNSAHPNNTHHDLSARDRHILNDNVQFARLTGSNHVLIESLHMTPRDTPRKGYYSGRLNDEDNGPHTGSLSVCSSSYNMLSNMNAVMNTNVSSSLNSTLNSNINTNNNTNYNTNNNSNINSTTNSRSPSRSNSFIRKQSSTRGRKISNVFNLSDDITDHSAKMTIDPSMKDEKLRNSLLTMSREKYRMTKKVEILGDEVEILKTKLEISELKCRHLQIDLAEVRGTDDAAPFALSLMGSSPPLVKPKDFGPVDELFKMMIERRAYNPVESILQFRRIVEVMSRMPGSLKVRSVAMHMCSNRMMQILDVDMICIFIVDFKCQHKVLKYTIRSENAEEIDTRTSPSLLAEALKGGAHMKYSDMKNSGFDMKIDGCPGIVVRNILSVPLKEEGSDRIMGCVHLLNKYEGKVAFTELDEIFATVYAEMAVSALSGCQKLQHVSFRADTLTAILVAPTRLLAVLPEKDSLFAKQILPFEVLKILEESSREALRCFKVKAFLVSDRLKGVRKGLLLARDDLGVTSSQSARGSGVLKQSSINTGVAGFVADSKKWVVQPRGVIDVRAHPDVDLDPLGMPCVTVPVLNLQGDVIACLQMVCGHGSPKIDLSESRADGFGFEQAATHLCRTLSGPLQSVLTLMWENVRRDDSSSALSLSMGSFLEDPSALPSEDPTSIEALVKEKVAMHFQLRLTMGFVEIEAAKVDEFKGDLDRMRKENEEYQRASAVLRRDLVATQSFYNKDKKWPTKEKNTDAADAKEIAGRIRMKKAHSRRLSFS